MIVNSGPETPFVSCQPKGEALGFAALLTSERSPSLGLSNGIANTRYVAPSVGGKEAMGVASPAGCAMAAAIALAESWTMRSWAPSDSPVVASTKAFHQCSPLVSSMSRLQASRTDPAIGSQTSLASIGLTATPPSETVVASPGPPRRASTLNSFEGFRPRCPAAARTASTAALRAFCPPAAAAMLATKRFPALSTFPSRVTFTFRIAAWTSIPLWSCWRYTWVTPVCRSVTSLLTA